MGRSELALQSGQAATAGLRKLFTVDDYHAMAHAGILDEDDRVELIEGDLIQMPAIGSRHQAIVDRLNRLFVTRLGDSTIVRVQGPVRLARITEPQPDLQLLAPRDDFYEPGHPSQQESLLVIEVSDTSLRFDRDEKSVIYARRGLRELWIVDLANERILVMREPTQDGYRQSAAVARGGSLSPLTFPDLVVTSEDILGPPARRSSTQESSATSTTTSSPLTATG